jgi:hypothetical protein
MSYSKAFPLRWFLFMDQGPARVRQWVAEADGTDLRKPGELSARERRRNEQRTACMRKAGDAVAVSRCLERFNP